MAGSYYSIPNDGMPWSQRAKMRRQNYGFFVVLGVIMTSIIGTWMLLATARGTPPPTTSRPSGNPSRPPSNLSKKQIDLGYVKYTGVHDKVKGINYYRGIPYAIPPIGQHRWQPPRSIESENDFHGEEVIADTPGPSCYQACIPGIPFDRLAGQSEDCLYLDILVPDKPVSSRLPVVVMIHGGAYSSGNAQQPGDALVHSSKGQMIYISIQYRLGVFGFLAGSEIRNDGTANAGLLDQRCALEWISQNIKAFGGDPSQITIWGASAGAGSVIYQMMAYGGSGSVPFRAAIPESPWHPPLLNEVSQDMMYRAVLKSVGCDSLSCLRETTPETLQDANNNLLEILTTHGVLYFGPVVDDDFVRDLPTQAFKSGRFHHVPTLVTHSIWEGSLFTPPFDSQVDETTDAKKFFPAAGPSFFSRLYQLYPSDAFDNFFWQRQTWFGDFIISCPSYTFASSITDHSVNSTTVFKMLFDAGTHTHCATLAFLLSEDIDYPGLENRFLAKVMPSYWISFILTMDPNPIRVKDAPFWSSYSADGRGSQESGESIGFDVMTVETDTMFMQTDPDASPRCDFFAANSAVIRI